jgi:Helix-turn-helix domain
MKMKDTEQHTNDGAPRGTTNQRALKLKAACEYLGGISPNSVRRLIKRNLLKPNRALRHMLIPVSELDRFLGEGHP